MSFCLAIAAFWLALASCSAATLIWPENRTAYYADESIEIAVTGLDAGQSAAVQFAPAAKTLKPLAFPVTGDGSTVTFSVPAYTFSPSSYSVSLDAPPPAAGAAAQPAPAAPDTIVISSGVRDSTFLISQTSGGPGCTFTVGNSYGYGLIGPDGLPMKDVRDKRSGGMQFFDNQVAKNMPTLVPE